MATRIGWYNNNLRPGGASYDLDQADYEPANSGTATPSGSFLRADGGINNDGSPLGTIVWTPTWIPAVADPIPTIEYDGTDAVFRVMNIPSASGPFGELHMAASMDAVPIPGYLRLVLLETPTNGYGHAAWDSVGAGAQTCDFSAAPTSGADPLEVEFTDESDPTPTSWAWDFGDGGTSTVQNPTHIYTEPGLYTVGLFINDEEFSEIKEEYISVSASPAPSPSPGAAMSVLPVSRLINVSVNLTPAGAQGQDLSTLLILGTSTVIDNVERMRLYSRIEDVAADFGTEAEEYLSALLWFEQVPQPSQVMIGRWVDAASNGGLRGAVVSAADQQMSVWTAISAGSFTFTKDAGSPQNITGLDFSGAANLNAVAAIIQDELSGVTVVWNAAYGRFEMTSTTTGATSAISFLSAAPSGTDISALLGMRSTSSGAYRFLGQAAESALEAVQLMALTFGQQWYALIVPSAVNSDHLPIAAFIEASDTKHFYGVTTQEAGVLSAVDTTNIAYQLKQLARKKTMVQYSSSNAYAVVSALARILTTNYQGNSTVITLMYKQEPGIVAEQINNTQAEAAESFNCNIFAAYDNNTAIFQPGVTSSGIFVDIVLGTDWLAVDLIRNLYNLLYTSLTKIPQTDAGTALLVTTCESVLSQAVINGLLAPGVWNAGGFGQLNQGDYLAKGFYVYAPSVNDQDPADRAARISVPIQIAAKLAGAVHEVQVAVLVNQ
jgi:PKD repeat protein